MAFGGRELRLILSIQSYGTGNIARLRRDIMSLQSATDIANKQALMQARLAQRAGRVTAAQQELRDVKAGLPFYQARNKAMMQWGRANAGILSTQARQLSGQKQLYDIETQRIATRAKLSAAKSRYGGPSPKEVELLERKLVSLDMAEGIVTKNTQALNEQLAVQKTQLAELDAEYKRLIRDTGAQSAATKQAEANLAAETAAYNEQAAALERLNLQQKMNVAQQREIRGRSLAHVGRTMQFAGLIGLAGFSLAASSAAKFNQELVLAATQARNVNAPLSQVVTRTKQLENGFDHAGTHFQGILELMQQFPASADDMAKAAYDIYSSMQVSFGGGLTLLKQFNQLAVATGSDLTTATSAGITVLNNFSHAGMTTNQVLNLMVATIRFGRMHLEEFNQMLGKVAPAAKNAGQSFKDVAGAMALITTRQPSATQGATQLARLLQTFSDPDFQKGTYRFGVDITKGSGAVGALKPLPEIINSLNKAFGTYTSKGGVGELFKELTAVGRGSGQGRASRIEAQRGYLFLIKNIRDYRAIQLLTTTDTQEFAKSLKAMSQSPGVQWQIFINQMRAFIIVIGQAALPALLKLAGYLEAVAHWFEGLSNGMKTAIVRAGVFTTAFLLLGGTFLNIIGSLIALQANLAITRGELAATGATAETASIQMQALGIAAKGLAALSVISIPIVMQMIRGGDPTGWDLLQAAGFGALGGAMAFGPLGAGIGAITLPVIIELQSENQKLGQTAPKGVKASIAKAYQQYADSLKKGVGGFFRPIVPFNFFLSQQKSFKEWLKDHPKLMKIEEQYQRKHNGTMTGIQKQYHDYLRKENAAYVKSIKDSQNQLSKAYQDQANNTSAANQRAEQIAKAHTNAMQQALQKEKETIKTATDNLMNVYDNLRQQNQEAIGGIFQGPTMQGMLGGIFSSLNDQLRQFGIQIPVPFAILKKDMDQSLAYAKRWFKDIAKLRKAGVPEDVVQELEKMGPAGIPIIEGMLQNGKKGARALGKEWHKALGPNGIVTKQTQTDMNATLAYWNTFGHKAAWQMAQGIINSPDEAKIRTGFQNYIKNTFGDILAQQARVDAATYMKNFMQDLNAAGGLPTTTATGGSKGSGGGRVRPLSNAQLRMYIKRANVAEGNIRARLIQLTFAKEVRPLTPLEQKEYTQDIKNLKALDAAEKHWRKILAHRMFEKRERASVIKQMKAEAGLAMYTITYGGDTVHIKADGATPAAVVRALDKHRFTRKNKNKKKSTGKP